MSNRHTIHLKPVNKVLEVDHGTPLQDVLFVHGVEFPCGGKKRCTGCKIKVLRGSFPVTSEQEELLSEKELKAGWRLACCGNVIDDLDIELAQWEASVLTDNSSFPFKPKAGYGIAVDIGTTTIVAQLLDLSNGTVIGVNTALNKQAQYGADIMERINYAISAHGGTNLGALLRDQIESLLTELIETTEISVDHIDTVVLAGNTVMQHFFCDFDLDPLSHVPFEPVESAYEVTELSPVEPGWKHRNETSITFLPSLGGFVGSDILAGIIATGMHKRTRYSCLVDLGTNGEIVIGNKNRLLCASTAAGPAFEGARISMGMRAVTGAIASVEKINGAYKCTIIGGGTPRGICGSGLVDAVSVGLDLGFINSSGRFEDKRNSWELLAPVSLTQQDIRELQLAKGAIAAGITILLNALHITIDDIAQVHLAGAFGNYINRESARNIGLLPFPVDKIQSSGNTSLLGAKRALFMEEYDEIQSIQKITRHIPLSTNPAFMEIFSREMLFPER